MFKAEFVTLISLKVPSGCFLTSGMWVCFPSVCQPPCTELCGRAKKRPHKKKGGEMVRVQVFFRTSFGRKNVIITGAISSSSSSSSSSLELADESEKFFVTWKSQLFPPCFGVVLGSQSV